MGERCKLLKIWLLTVAIVCFGVTKANARCTEITGSCAIYPKNYTLYQGDGVANRSVSLAIGAACAPITGQIINKSLNRSGSYTLHRHGTCLQLRIALLTIENE